MRCRRSIRPDRAYTPARSYASRVRPGEDGAGEPKGRRRRLRGRIQALPPGSASRASPSANPVGRREERCRDGRSLGRAGKLNRGDPRGRAAGVRGAVARGARAAARRAARAGRRAGPHRRHRCRPRRGARDLAPPSLARRRPPTSTAAGAAHRRRFACRSACGVARRRPARLARARARPQPQAARRGRLPRRAPATPTTRRSRRAACAGARARARAAHRRQRPRSWSCARTARARRRRRAPLTVEPRPVALPAGIDRRRGRRAQGLLRRRSGPPSCPTWSAARSRRRRGRAGPRGRRRRVARGRRGEVAPGVGADASRWDGTAAGEVAARRLYQFRVTATDASGARATSSATGAARRRRAHRGTVAGRAFTFLRYRFPLVGAHDYGEGAARSAAAAGHQGQDVFAACGTPLVAARGGVVKFKQYQSRAPATTS